MSIIKEAKDELGILAFCPKGTIRYKVPEAL